MGIIREFFSRFRRPLGVKKLKLDNYCHECGEKLHSLGLFSLNKSLKAGTNAEVIVRKYLGGHGHLVEMGMHRKCLVHWMYLDLILNGWTHDRGVANGRQAVSKTADAGSSPVTPAKE